MCLKDVINCSQLRPLFSDSLDVLTRPLQALLESFGRNGRTGLYLPRPVSYGHQMQALRQFTGRGGIEQILFVGVDQYRNAYKFLFTQQFI